jgi:(p)ppGpp synthase/HD superfamily hydrolase
MQGATEPRARWTPGPRFAAALALAAERHGDQARKGSSDPYATHLLAVSAMVIEHGGTEDQAIAALLHDVVEDTGATYEELAGFGPTVVAIMRACDALSREDFSVETATPSACQDVHLSL